MWGTGDGVPCMWGADDVAWMIALALIALVFVIVLIAAVARYGRRPSGPERPKWAEAEEEPGSFAPRTFADDLGGQVDAIIFVYQLERNERPIARDLRRLAARFGPDLKPREGEARP